MTSTTLTDENRKKLKRVSTATLTTALVKRGFRNVFIQDVRPLSQKGESMVGEAFTLRYIPAREDLDHLGTFEGTQHPQRRAVEDCPPGHVMVIDSRKDPRAASAGGILVSRLMQRGVAGIVTDGGFRDSPEIAAMAIPAYHNRPSAPTNLIRHHALDINAPIACGAFQRNSMRMSSAISSFASSGTRNGTRRASSCGLDRLRSMRAGSPDSRSVIATLSSRTPSGSTVSFANCTL